MPYDENGNHFLPADHFERIENALQDMSEHPEKYQPSEEELEKFLIWLDNFKDKKRPKGESHARRVPEELKDSPAE